MPWLVLLVVLLAGCQAPSVVVTPAAAEPSVDQLVVKGRGVKAGYSRAAFGPAWADVDRNGCDTRNDVLARDLTQEAFRRGTCVVLSGVLDEPYTGRTVRFVKARAFEVQIDHVVALSDAWQKGAAQWGPQQRLAFANDPLNLLAVDGRANQAKGDSDTASWLPPYKPSRCAYVSRQVAVKLKYRLSVTRAERDAMARVLWGCSQRR
jgi:hypothetical protein